MRPIQNADGHVGLSAREYPIAAATAIKRGQVVKLSGGAVISAAAAETGAILGIAAENHPGTADVLNPRANGEAILVYDSPLLIFECPAPQITAASGTAATVTAASGSIAAAIADDAFNGGVIQLKSKAAGSANTEVVGEIFTVTDYDKATLTLTHAAAGTACAGDVYRVYPPVGSAFCALDSNFEKAVISASGAASLRVVGHDTERGRLRMMAAVHTLGNDD